MSLGLPRMGWVAPWVLIAAIGCTGGQNTESIKSEQQQAAKPMPAQQDAQQPAAQAPALGEGMDGAQGLVWVVPEGFQSEPPANTMRVAQYKIPSGTPGTKDGELVVFFFGAGQGGAVQANIERWASQFKQDDGSDPMKKAKTGTMKTPSGLTVSFVELSGHYVSSMMGSGPSYDEPGWRLYGAVIEGPGGPWFFKAAGPEEVILKHRDALTALYQGVRTHS